MNASQSNDANTRINVLGSKYSYVKFDNVVHAVLTSALDKNSGYVCVSNVHTTMMGYFDPSYQSITNDSFLSVPDGMPVRWAMNFLGEGNQDRVRGPALMRAVCDLGRSKGVRHFLYGATKATLEKLERYLLEQYPGIEIAGKISPPFRKQTEEEIEQDLRAIADSGAHIVWVGLGAPKQEIWMSKHSKKIAGITLGVGAAFDLLPGVVREAPQWIQNIGMEWLYRFFMEPRRLWKRYIINNPAFVILVLGQIIKQKIFGSRKTTA